MTTETERTFTTAEIRAAIVCTWPEFESMANQHSHKSPTTKQFQRKLMKCCNQAGLNIRTSTELRCLMALVESNHLREAWDEDNDSFEDDADPIYILSSGVNVFKYSFPSLDEVQNQFLSSPVSFLPFQEWSQYYTEGIHWYCKQIWLSFTLQKTQDLRFSMIERLIQHLYDTKGRFMLELIYSVLLLVLRDKKPSAAEWFLFKMHIDRPFESHQIITQPLS